MEGRVKGCRMPVLVIAPETGRLPDDMGPLARYIFGKSGGMGDVIATLCEGLTKRGVECHVATLNLRKRFQWESHMSEEQWSEIQFRIDPARIHLVSSAVFADLPSAYAGDPLLNAAELQKQIINHIIIDIRSKNSGNLLVHSHDWMAGGAITAYAKSTGCPVLHTVHNVHTGHLPVEMLLGVDVNGLNNHLYFSKDRGRRCIDCQASAIKSASLVSFVGLRFLREIVEDQFSDQSFIPSAVRNEVKVKYHYGSTRTIPNAPSLGMYPEHCDHLAVRYGPDDDVLAAKRANRIELQRRTGLIVNPDAILLYWPSRLDPSQKGIELLEQIAQSFVTEHPDVQIAIVGDGVGSDRTHEDICGRIAWTSGGKITYQHFSESLSMLGFGAASDVFGVSLYEPCGQIDQVGNLFGATATNRDTGGYHDKILELRLAGEGVSEDEGNGFLFLNYDTGGLWYGLHKSVEFHRRPAEVRDRQVRRIMRETRQHYDVGKMIDAYIDAYETINGGRPLV